MTIDNSVADCHDVKPITPEPEPMPADRGLPIVAYGSAGSRPTPARSQYRFYGADSYVSSGVNVTSPAAVSPGSSTMRPASVRPCSAMLNPSMQLVAGSTQKKSRPGGV